MNELEIPHIYRAAARGSSKRQILLDRRGAFVVPYIEDPNNKIAMFESKDIVDYLEQKYAN